MLKKFFPVIVFSLVLVFCSSIPAIAQTEAITYTIKLKNNTLLPKKLTVITYTPGETGNSTMGTLIAPGFSKSYKFKEGTKVYLASGEQVDIVMSGKRIDNDKPFLVVKKEDDGKSFNIEP